MASRRHDPTQRSAIAFIRGTPGRMGTTRAPKYGVDVGSVAKKQAKEEIQKGLIKLFQKN